jgi:hypothetical protein
LQTVIPERIEAIQAKAEALQAQLIGNPDALLTADETIGLLLQAAITGFWFEGDVLESLLARFMEVRKFRPTPGGGIAFLGLTISAAFGVPFSAQANGSMGFDVKRSVLAVHPIADNIDAVPGFMRASGLLRSQLEASALERVLGQPNPEAISTTVILRIANEQNIPIYVIDNSNLQQIIGLPYPLGGGFKNLLQVPEDVKWGIFNSVNAGRIVTIPQQEVMVGSWKGTGYVIENPATGGAAYLLTGGRNGGSISFLHLCSQDPLELQTRAILGDADALIEWVSECLKNLIGFDEDKFLEDIKNCAVKNNHMPGDPAVNLRLAGIHMSSVLMPTILAYFAPGGIIGSLYNNLFVPMYISAMYIFMRRFVCGY